MEETFQHPEVLEESTPDIINDALSEGTSFLTQYGWFILAGLIAVLYFRPRIEDALDKIYKDRADREYTAKCKKDPDWLRERQMGIEAARQRMQEELNRKSKEYVEKQKELEEKKRQEQIEKNNDVGGNTLQPSKKSNYRPEYHPLMGGGGSGGYRPPRRSCCPSSGGCG